MKRSSFREPDPALDRLETAVHLLRATPLSDFVLWIAGSGPFALGLLYFWADQSRSSTAAERLPASSLGIALLFLWARTTQAAFAGRLYARLSGEVPSEGVLTLLRRSVVPIAAWQPLALAMLPPALLLVVPFPFFLAFQQGLILSASRPGIGPGRVLQEALRQCAHDARRISGEASLLALAWLVLLINTGVCLFALPRAAKLLVGIESPFTLNPAAAFNTTFLAATLLLATLLIDPLVKAVFVLRDFERTSRTTGADLLAALRRIPLGRTLALAVLLIGSAASSPATAASAPRADIAPTHIPAVAPADLNRSIVEVLDRPEFTWREPRVQASGEEAPAPRSFLESLFAPIGRMLTRVGKWLESPLQSFGDWLDRMLRNRTPAKPSNFKFDPSGLVEFLMWLLVVVAAILLGGFGYRLWASRRPSEPAPAPPSAAPTPDLDAAEVSADLLPGDAWLSMAHELAARGEHRLALRAAFLACLTRLADHQWIRLARTRSNREYEADVRRRTHGHPENADQFSEIVRVFERSWYGERPVTADRFAEFVSSVERLQPS